MFQRFPEEGRRWREKRGGRERRRRVRSRLEFCLFVLTHNEGSPKLGRRGDGSAAADTPRCFGLTEGRTLDGLQPDKTEDCERSEVLAGASVVKERKGGKARIDDRGGPKRGNASSRT